MNTFRYEDISIGQSASFQIRITEEMLCAFRQITGDENPLHSSADFARDKGYPDKVAFGMLTASFLSTLAGVYLPGENSLIHSVETEFPKPVFAGDMLYISGTVTEKDDRFSCIYLKVVIRNQKGEKVCRGKMRIGVLP